MLSVCHCIVQLVTDSGFETCVMSLFLAPDLSSSRKDVLASLPVSGGSRYCLSPFSQSEQQACGRRAAGNHEPSSPGLNPAPPVYDLRASDIVLPDSML